MQPNQSHNQQKRTQIHVSHQGGGSSVSAKPPPDNPQPSWGSVSPNKWDGSFDVYSPAPSSLQYKAFQTTPPQQTYSQQQEHWSSPSQHAHPDRPMGFPEGFSLNNGVTKGSPDTPTTQTSSIVISSTPQCPITNGAFNSQIQPTMLHVQYPGQYPSSLNPQSSGLNSQQQYSTKMLIFPSSPAAMRTPSPSQPQVNSGVFYRSPAPAVPPQSLPFPLSQQRSSDSSSSPGTPHQHVFAPHAAPTVFHGLQSPHSNRQEHHHHVAFRDLPEVLSEHTVGIQRDGNVYIL